MHTQITGGLVPQISFQQPSNQPLLLWVSDDPYYFYVKHSIPDILKSDLTLVVDIKTYCNNVELSPDKVKEIFENKKFRNVPVSCPIVDEFPCCGKLFGDSICHNCLWHTCWVYVSNPFNNDIHLYSYELSLPKAISRAESELQDKISFITRIPLRSKDIKCVVASQLFDSENKLSLSLTFFFFDTILY
jgi:hypothetical protein